MAKIKSSIFATTALVAFAGAASADVALTGSAEMGIAGGSDIDTTFFQSVDVRFTMSGETDNGLSFGAVVDLDDASDRPDTTGLGDIRGNAADFTVFVSGEFGTLTMGDTDGAFDSALTETGMGGSIADDHTGHAGYSGNGGFGALGTNLDGAGLDGLYNGQVLRYEYSVADFGIAVSAEVPNDRTITLNGANWELGANIGIGGTYSANGISVGAAYQFATAESQTAGTADADLSAIGLSVGYEMGAFNVVANASETKLENGAVEATVDHVAIGASYTMDALTLAANWGEYTFGQTGTADVDQSGYGLAVNYDLGGGAVIQFGYGGSESITGNDTDTWSFGLAMSF